MIGIDTNILIYAVDNRAGQRHHAAGRLLRHALRQQTLFLPVQVLGEFCNAATRKLGQPADAIEPFLSSWTALARIEPYRAEDLGHALHAHAEHGLPFWDALIWAVCARAGVPVLASEDFQNGRTLGRVTFLDPFDPANATRLGLG
jgi:predicted nucleic acid-binding protein